MKMHSMQRILALVLVFALAAGFAVPVHAENGPVLTLNPVDDSTVSASLLPPPDTSEEVQMYADHENVRVSIVLEEDSTLEAGFRTEGIAENAEAMAYRSDLYAEQQSLTRRIERTLGEKLDVVWNLTLAANIISANVEYGQIDEISKIPGVSKVVIEKTYKPLESVTSAETKPNMVVSAGMTGAKQAWDIGYYGAGTRVAVIDTGLDTDHQSFSPEALEYAFRKNADAEKMEYEDYVASLHLLTEAEIAEKLPQLNIHKLMPELTAQDLYVNTKAPFGINYIDRNQDITHDNDSASEHGSHVSGISSGNRYIPQGDTFVPAVDSVFTLGNAPDSQIIVMKVFGVDSPTDADYMAALEDAILLDCDVANLSLGGSNPGGTISLDYENIMDSLVNSDTVVAIAAGNEGPWSAHAGGTHPNLYVEDVGMQTSSEPATFTNSLAVASVDNNGMITTSLVFDGKHMGYVDGKSEWCDPFAKLDKNGTGTEYDFVFLTSEGKNEDYEGIDVNGKIVLVSRGDINFTEKAENAVEHGAIGTLVYNNVVDNTIMVLEGYWESEPCAMISRDDAATMKAGSTEQTAENGTVYYTGKLTVDSKLSPIENGHDYYTMSAFSSWGVPGDLSMKPEITAPGGNIYSVNGAVPETDQYEVMSGTSMATPQVAGLSALLMEHIRKNTLSQDGMTDRALAQSLLMSTAEPMRDSEGKYISILQQGAGLANIRNAVAAKSYVTIENQKDGKAKFELGDDPARSGSYTMSFELHNLTDADAAYALSAELFTQDTFVDYANKKAQMNQNADQMATFMAYSTRKLAASAQWSSDTEIIHSVKELTGCDFDGSGSIDRNDAQALLDYTTGKRASIEKMENADLSGDGKISTHDVYVFLEKYEDEAVLVPANGSVKVTVTLTLTDEEKAYVNETYPNGCYIEGFVHAEGMPDAEGVAGTAHSIPVLGFYGNWTDPSMFELGTIQEKLSGQEFRTTYTGEGETLNNDGEEITPSSYNTLEVEYFRDPGYNYLLGGNPVDPDETPNPERTAINNQNGDKLHSYKFSPIRNAASSRVQITDKDGKVLWQRFPGPYGGAYYGIMMFFPMWINSNYRFPINFVPRDLAEGESFTASVTLAPEYNTDMVTERADWDSLGHGATLSTSVRIDNTDPEIHEVSMNLMANTLTVEASDNQYVAGVALFDRSGRTVLSSTGSIADAQPGDTDEFVLSLQNANGKKFLVQVFDYAYNVSTYELSMELGDPVPMPQLLAHDLDYAEYGPGYWTGFQVDSDYKALSTYAKSPVTMRAATMCDPYIYAYAEDGALYVLHKEDMLSPIRVGVLTQTLDDMAYSAKDGKIYVIYQKGEDSILGTMDKLTGAIAEVGTIGMHTNTLAVTADGVFYGNALGTSKVYRYTLDTLSQPELVGECLGENDAAFEAKDTQSMEYDPNTGNVVWISYTFKPSSWGGVTDSAYLYEITPKGEILRHNDMLHHLVALVIPDKSARNDDYSFTDTASKLTLSEDEVFLMKSQSHTLTADVLPWTASDRFVYWESDHPEIASVDGKGYVEALSVGTATITATSRMNSELIDTVTIHVSDVKVTVDGLLQDSAGKPSTFSWNLEEANDWETVFDLDTDLMAATAKDDYTFYVTSGNGRTVKKVDLFSGSEVLSQWQRPMNDLAYSPVFSGETDRVHAVYMTLWLPAKDMAATPDGNAWDLASLLEEQNGGSEFVGIASGGPIQYTDELGVSYDAELLYLLDDQGGVLKLYTYKMLESDPNYDPDYPYNAGADYLTSDLSEMGYTISYDNNDNPLSSLVVGNDGNLYFAGFNGNSSELYQLVFDAETNSYKASLFADMGEGVWPVALTKVTANPKPEAPTAVSAASMNVLADAKKVEITEQADGHLMAAKAQPIQEETDEITVTVQAEAASNNGLLDVTYDENLLTLTGVNGASELTSHVDAEGKLTFGFAGLKAVSQDETLLTLTFVPTEQADGDRTELVITTHERNAEALDTQETVTLTLPEQPTDPEPTDPEPTDPEPTDPEPTDPEPTDPEPTDPEPTDPEPTDPEPTNPEPTDPEPTEPEPTDPEPVDPAEVFEDVDREDWFYDAVSYVYNHDLMTGMSETVFGPNVDMTRAHLVTVLYRMAGSPEVEITEAFTDVDADDWYAAPVSWAVENGITQGMSETRFAANLSLTREQMVVFLARYAKFSGEDVTASGDLSKFLDAEDVHDWALDAMTWAVETGLIEGMGGNYLKPQDTSTRAQIATLLMRYLNK